MSWISQIAVGAAVVITVVGSLVWMAKKGFFEPEETNEDSQDQREELSDSVGDQSFSIPFRKRVSAWSFPYKVFMVSMGLLLVGTLVMSYQVMKTGSPVQKYLTSEVRTGVIALLGIAGGVWLKGWFDEQLGRLVVIYERAGQENLVEIVQFAKQGVRRRNGQVTAPEVAGRLFGLFHRYRQVGEDRRLRGEDKPLSDVITHLVPDHGDELPDGEGWVVQTHANGDRILSGATSTADVTYGSPNTLSDEMATQTREKMKRQKAELDAVKATNAELYRQQKKMRKKIKNEEYEDRTELIEDFDRFANMFSTLRVDINDSSESSGPLENGEKKEANT